MEGASSPKRRLPTKASSGRFALPQTGSPRAAAASGFDDLLDDCVASTSSQQGPSLQQLGSPRKVVLPSEQPVLEPSPSSPAPAPTAPAPPRPCDPDVGYGGPKPLAVKPPPLKTGPLNASATPQANVLPVKRRGSYQSLKRGTGIKTEDEPSVIGMIKKATHWERFGTIMVLSCLANEGTDGEAVLQLLQAEGYDTEDCESQKSTVAAFSARDVFPDVVLIDTDKPGLDTAQLIRALQAQNAAVAIMCIGKRGGRLDAVGALQCGAADFMYKPLDLEEMIARFERHVQRQHCIKLELENVIEGAKAVMAQLGTATALGDLMLNRGKGSTAGSRLIAVAETDFEQQITELSDENHKLDTKLQEMELNLEHKATENRLLNEKLNQLEIRMSKDSTGVQGQLSVVASQNNALMKQVDALEKIVRRSVDLGCMPREAPSMSAGEANG